MHLLSDMAQLAETTHSPTLGRVPSRRTVAVRLEGGLGDHVLGMRVLPFVHRSFPKHQIIVYSDAAGHAGQLQVAAMSPIVASVVPVQSRPKDRTVVGRLENVRPQDLTRMFSADVFIDGW